MTSPRFKSELLNYEVVVPCTEEGLMMQLTKYDGDIYGTAIEGYCHHANGDPALVEQKKIFRSKGDQIVRVKEESMHRKPFQYVFDALVHYAKIQSSI